MSFFFAGALHGMASGGLVLGLGEEPSIPPSRCLFPTALLGLPVFLVLLLRPFSTSGCFSESSQFYAGLSGHNQNTRFCPNTFLGPENSIFCAAAASM